ncbi:hypothetical protein PAAL109150_25365 [Paenibacillus alkaliterrae]
MDRQTGGELGAVYLKKKGICRYVASAGSGPYELGNVCVILFLRKQDRHKKYAIDKEQNSKDKHRFIPSNKFHSYTPCIVI